MTAEPLRPPPEHAHLRWHWLIPHDDHYSTSSRDAPEVFEWVPFDPGHRSELDYWKTPKGTIRPKEAALRGWRYHGPCDPAAVTLNPDDPAQVEAVFMALRKSLKERNLYVSAKAAIEVLMRRDG